MPFAHSRLLQWALPPHGERRSAAWRYGIAIAAVAAAAGVQLLIHPVLIFYTPFVLAVTVAALFGGRGPGLAAEALSGVIAYWFYLRPLRGLFVAAPSAFWGFGVFLVSAALIALLVGSLRELLLVRPRAEETLEQQARLIDLSHDAIFIMDRERHILTWNKGAQEIYGWTEQDAVGRVPHELLHTVSTVPLSEIKETLSRERRWVGELTQTARDGRRLIVDSRQVLIGDGGGRSPVRILAINHDVTYRKQTEEALRASEARLKCVLEAANLGAWDFDLASRETWRSAEHDAIFGYPAPLPEWTPEMFLDHVVPEDRAEVGRMLRQAITGADVEYECRIRRAGGALRWIWVKGRPQRDPEGRPLRITGIIGDITPRKKMEEDLRQSEEQFRTLANAIPQLCGMANADGSFFWINRRWFDFTGLTPEQSKGRRWMSALDPENSREALERWRHSIATGEPFESVFGVRGADDAFHTFLGSAVPLRNRDGRVVRWFGTMTDITEQRKTEDALRKSHREEMTRARELEAIMEAMPVAVFLCRDSECRNIMGNRTAYELLRRPPASNLSKSAPEGERPDTFRFVRSGKEIPASELPIQQAAATGHRIQDYEMDAVFEDGTARSLIGIAVPLLDAEGFPRGAVAVFGDITERKRTEERLRQVQKLESIGLLAGGVAHDFNNLLTVIMGNADAALQQYPSSEELQRIISASEKAADLTRQLLAYAGKGRFLSETFDLSDLVTRSTHLLMASIPKRVELLLHRSPQPVLVDADHSQIEQILLNLVINAGEAIPSNSVGRIEIATNPCDIAPEINRARASAFDVRPGPFVCLEVKDTGSGMDEATLAHIFDPFFSTKFMGRGLGLAAVQGIVRSYNGYIEVHSSPGAGSAFRIFLPASAKQLDAVAPPAPRPRAFPRRRTPRRAILIVEDEELVLRLASTALRSRGYQVLEAGNGRDALDVLARAARPPALVLLDLTMPVMGGEELVSILNRDYPNLPILLTSGYPEEEAQRAFPPGAVAAFLQKPYTVAALAEKVERTLDSGGGSPETLAAA